MAVSSVTSLVALLLLSGVLRTLAEKGVSPSGSTGGQNSVQGATAEPVFNITDLPDHSGIIVNITAPSYLLAECSAVWMRWTSSQTGIRKEITDNSTAADGSNVSSLIQHSVSVAFGPMALNNYCLQLDCSCSGNGLCRRHPATCDKRYTFRAGVNEFAWVEQTTAFDQRLKDTDSGPAISVVIRQHGHRFPRLLVSHDGCADPYVDTRKDIGANETYLLHGACALAYDREIMLTVMPSTKYCNSSGNCLPQTTRLGPLRRQPPTSPPPLPLPPPLDGRWLPLLIGGPLLLVLLLAAAGLLWLRRSHCRSPDKRHANTDGPESGHHGLAVPGAAAQRRGPSVLLLHLAGSDVERAAVRRLTAELHARGAAVTDSGTSEWRSAALRDAAALPSAVPLHDRVLLLSSPAAVAAVAAEGGGGGVPERLLAAAVRQLSGGRLTSDYGRLYQARLTADAPTVAGLVPGAVYTLPEHQHELVTALLAGNVNSNSCVDDVNGCVNGCVDATSPDAKCDANSDTGPGANTNNTNPETNTNTSSDTNTRANSNTDTSTNSNINPDTNTTPDTSTELNNSE